MIKHAPGQNNILTLDPSTRVIYVNGIDTQMQAAPGAECAVWFYENVGKINRYSFGLMLVNFGLVIDFSKYFFWLPELHTLERVPGINFIWGPLKIAVLWGTKDGNFDPGGVRASHKRGLADGSIRRIFMEKIYGEGKFG